MSLGWCEGSVGEFYEKNAAKDPTTLLLFRYPSMSRNLSPLPLPLLSVWQVSRVAEFTPCLLQIVLDNVDLPVRQAGKLTHVSKLCHACVYGS